MSPLIARTDAHAPARSLKLSYELPMKYVACCLIVLLLVLHQDYWQWDNGTLLFGFLPYALFYHACLSVAASAVWLFVVSFCWPHELDEIDSLDDGLVQGER